MRSRRASRVNSLLKEVISEVIRRDLNNPHLTNLLTVTDVEITQDCHHAKVYVSVIGDEAKKKQTLDILNGAKGFIAVFSSKQVKLRYFPELTFKLDDGVEKQMRIEKLLHEIKKPDGDEAENAEEDESELEIDDSDEDLDEESEELDDDSDADEDSDELEDDSDEASEELEDDSDEASEELDDDSAEHPKE